ncbi:hypothetical protein J3458_019913 [Metarhizium acridum]|uniref:uncharacterized protein n=1 Tax=Metarhizium acridum TaxID=92637 RepID=UPI001C6AE370|nr:hypothetical protein J3458_019913 [Metarhizium acridum]
MAILAVSGVGNVTTTIRDNGHGVVAVHARNDSAPSETTVVLISEGIDFDHAVASVMYHARTMVSETDAVSQNRTNSRPKWDAKAITGWEQEWQDGLECYRTGSDQSQCGWSEFEADRKAFPSGLRSVVAQIRNLHPALQNITVWHALLGYWGGISPDGLIAKTYNIIKVTQEGENSHPLTVSGIDGVKADAQVMIDLLKDAPDRRDLISTYLDAWSKASKQHFGGKTISCMSQFPYSLPLSTTPK